MFNAAFSRFLVCFICACIIHPSSSFFFPAEEQHKAKQEEFCAQPTRLPDGDRFEYTTYTRVPPDSAHPELPQSGPPVIAQNHTDLLRKIHAHPLLLSRAQIQSGTVSPGDERIRRFAAKLVRGEPVIVVALGGSITAGHGVNTAPNVWVNRIFDYIEKTFPHPNHKLLNRAIPATTSSYVSPCVHTMIPEHADLVIVEFTLNDAADNDALENKCREEKQIAPCDTGFASPIRQAMERLVRKVLDLPSRPAMMYMHTWKGNRAELPYYYGVEDDYSVIMSYYSITTLSFRNAVHRQILETAGLRERFWPNLGDMHPDCIGTRAMADLAIGYLMDHLAVSAWQLPAKAPTEAPSHLPPALFDSNAGNFSTDCILDDTIQQYVTQNTGFNWVNEGHADSPKWGFVADSPGAQMNVKVPLQQVHFNGEDLVLGVGVLLSYRNMGILKLHCLAGCTCVEREYSTFISYSNWSMNFWRFLHVKVAPGSQECVIGITNLPKTYSKGHRVKVNSLLVSGNMASMQIGNAWIESGVINEPKTPTIRRHLVTSGVTGSRSSSVGRRDRGSTKVRVHVHQPL